MLNERDYKSEALRQLRDPLTYRTLGSDLTPAFKNKLKNLLDTG